MDEVKEACPECGSHDKEWMERSPDGRSKCKCGFEGPHSAWNKVRVVTLRARQAGKTSEFLEMLKEQLVKMDVQMADLKKDHEKQIIKEKERLFANVLATVVRFGYIDVATFLTLHQKTLMERPVEHDDIK